MVDRATRYLRVNGRFHENGSTDFPGDLDRSKGKPRVLTLVPTNDATHRATTSGEWDDPATWADDVPGSGARVHVPAGVTVTLDHRADARLDWLRVDGGFEADPTRDTELSVDTVVTTAGSRFTVGTEDDPVRSDVTATIEFVDDGPVERSEDPFLVGRGLVAMGDVEIVGAETSGWHTLDRHPRAGDTDFRLAERPTNWSVGDTVVTPGLEPYSDERLGHDDEERTITAVNGRTVSFDEPLAHDHVPPESDLDTYVLNLTRNVRFRSENDDIRHRGHLMVTSTESVLKYLQTREMGRTDKSRDVTSPLWGRGQPEPESPPNPRARYSIHFHSTGPTEPPHVVEGCVVWDDPGWGYVNHGSNARIEDNISYDVVGAGFVAEKGNEAGTFKRNFALRSTGSGEQTESRKGWSNAHGNRFLGPPHNIDDFGHSGHGFWLHSPAIPVEDNVAAGHRHTPISFWNRALHEQPLDDGEKLDGKHDMAPKVPAAILTEYQRRVGTHGEESESPLGQDWHDGDGTVYFTDTLPLRSFRNNVAFGCGGGFDISRVMFRNQVQSTERNVHEGNVGYNVGEMYYDDGSTLGREDFHSSGNVGLDHRYVGNLVADGYRLLGDGDGIGVYNNRTYIDDYHVQNSRIENWAVGLVPSRYEHHSQTDVVGCTFADNGVDFRIPGIFGASGRLVARDNSYSGTTRLDWSEIFVANLIPDRVVKQRSTRVRIEGRTVYHGWSDPEFVIVREGDEERLDKMMNHGNGQRWAEWLGVDSVDEVREILPGTTHRELYEEYGLTFYGGMRDPDAPDSDRPDWAAGSGGPYDSTPFLAPASKTQPTDEIWVDVVNHCSFSGDYEVLEAGDDVPNPEPIWKANDGTVVELREHGGYELPVSDEVGVASYTFAVDTPGTYHVHTRAQKATPGGGSTDERSRFFVRVDGGDWTLLDGHNYGVAPTNDLVWAAAYDPNNPNMWTEHDLETGEHTIEIAGKGTGNMRLDWLLIKHETVGANPAGKGKDHTPRR